MFILLSLGIILFTIICLLNLRAGALLIIFFLPLYLVRFNVFGAPTNVLDILIFILFIVWVGGGKRKEERGIRKEERGMRREEKGERRNDFFSRFLPSSSSIFPHSLFLIPHSSFLFPLSFLLAGSFISMALNANKLKSLGIIKSWFIAPIIFSAILISSFNTERQRELVLSVLATSGVGVALLSLAYKILGIVTYDGRLQGIFNSPNYLAMYLAPCILIILYKIIKQFSIFNFQFSINDQIFNSQTFKNSKIENLLEIRNWELEIQNDKKRKASWFISFIVVLAAFFFTFSYSAWISLFIAGLVFYIKSKVNPPAGGQNAKLQIKSQKYESYSKKLFIMFFLLLFCLFIILDHVKNPQMANLIHSKRYSIESRLMIWRSAGHILKENPLWGIGLGNFQEEYLALAGNFEKPYLQWAVPHPHNIFLAFWLNCGLLGLVGFIWILVLTIKKGLFFCHSREGENLMGILLFSILLYILLHGLVDTTYFKNDLAMMFWIILSQLTAAQTTSPAKNFIHSLLLFCSTDKREGINL